jgi:hypothetical protein
LLIKLEIFCYLLKTLSIIRFLSQQRKRMSKNPLPCRLSWGSQSVDCWLFIRFFAHGLKYNDVFAYLPQTRQSLLQYSSTYPPLFHRSYAFLLHIQNISTNKNIFVLRHRLTILNAENKGKSLASSRYSSLWMLAKGMLPWSTFGKQHTSTVDLHSIPLLLKNPQVR